ncbi:MAG: repeat-containing protein [Gemmatimonadales bacterium]|nr:repeat-containing protein [Gemmatimonadales bacterium]
MSFTLPSRRQSPSKNSLFARALAAILVTATLAPSTSRAQAAADAAANMSPSEPTPDPRVGLRPGLYDAAEAIWNLKVLSETRPSEKFAAGINSDLAFLGNYAIQGSFSGYQVWDISNPRRPALKTAYFCPASQSDVSVYRNLLFVSGEDLSARIDCGPQGVKDAVSTDRLRGIRIFDITDITNPKNVGNVQTCRGSHTHSLLVDPKDPNNVYVYISGSGPVRSSNELAGCVDLSPDKDPNSALFRIEVIKVPVAHPEQAAIVNSPRIFTGLTAPLRHDETAMDVAEQKTALEAAKARGGYTAVVHGVEGVVSNKIVNEELDSIVKARNGTGAPTAADSAALRRDFQAGVDRMMGENAQAGPRPGPNQCHDITLYPAIGRAGGACAGYGLLLDISDPAHPVRLNAVADSNFSYWHSATFNNDGSKLLFSDEWGGGMAPKCRSTDPREWGADAIFTVKGSDLKFQSYYKLPAPQTREENCVAHNGSLIPIPGRDVMVQSWYQGGISVFDWTDAAHPREIAYFDRGPADTTLQLSGTWSAYWYNGAIVSSEITRGLDILELAPSAFISQNEIDAAKTVHFDYYNTQDQQKFVWPPSFALARAYVDQLERSNSLASGIIADVRRQLAAAEGRSASDRRNALDALAVKLDADAAASTDASKVRGLATAVRDLAR